MSRFQKPSVRQRLVAHVQELERLEEIKKSAADDLKDGFDRAKADGFDTTTLKVVLKLRKMTQGERRERRALEAIYLAALGMLEGDPLPDEARRRLDGQPPPPGEPASQEHLTDEHDPNADAAPSPQPPAQPALVLKDPAEARTEGAEAAAAGKRIYDNPYPAGDPCRAAWDEGWCAQSKSHGMETPSAYQRRTSKPPEDPDQKDADDTKKGAA